MSAIFFRFKNWLILNAANFITVAGLVCAVWAIILLLNKNGGKNIGWVIGLNLIIALSDLADGWIARRWNIESAFGCAIDKLRDKIFIISELYILSHYYLHASLPTPITALMKTLVILTIFGECFGICMVLIGAYRGLDTKANKYGKRKMGLQTTAVIFWLIIIYTNAQNYFTIVSLISILLVAFVLALKSLDDYSGRFITK